MKFLTVFFENLPKIASLSAGGSLPGAAIGKLFEAELTGAIIGAFLAGLYWSYQEYAKTQQTTDRDR